MRHVHRLIGFGAFAAAAATLPAEAAPWLEAGARVGEWDVRPSRVGACSASRVYPGGTRLSISSDRGGYSVLSVRNVAWSGRTPGSYRMRLIQGGRAADLAGEADRASQGLDRSAEPGQGLVAQLADGGMVEVSDPNGVLLDRLDLSGLGPALRRLGSCVTEAATAANFPPPPLPPPRSTVRPPQPQVPINRLFSNGDYPAEAVRARQEGNVRFRLTVSKDGRVTNCVITASSRSSVLDSATCRLVRARARFTPALDAMGKPAEDTFSAVIAWRLPNVPGPPPAPRP